MANFSSYRRLFKTKNFLFFLANCAFGSLAHGLTYVSIAWLSQTKGTSLSVMALVMLGFWAPSLLLAVPVGIFIDRGNDRVAAVLSNTLRGLVLLVVAVILSDTYLSPMALFLLALSLGTFNSFYMPSIGVIIRKIIPQEDLLFANSMGDGCVELFSILGMGISGFVLLTIGLRYTLFLGGVLFVVAGLCFLFVEQINVAEKNNSPSCQPLLNWQFVIRTPNLLATYLMSGILFYLMMATPVLLAPYVSSLEHAGIKDFSMLEAGFSLGAVLGALLLPQMATKNKKLTLSIAWLLLGASFLFFALFKVSFVWHLSYLMIGLCLATWAIVHTDLQKITPLFMQGRLLAYSNGIWGSLVFLTFYFCQSIDSMVAVKSLYFCFTALTLSLIVILNFVVTSKKAVDKAYLT